MSKMNISMSAATATVGDAAQTKDLDCNGALLLLDFTSGVGTVDIEGRSGGSGAWVHVLKWGTAGVPEALDDVAATADLTVVLAGQYNQIRINGTSMSAGSCVGYLCGKSAHH